MVVWTTEKIAALPQKELESLFVNALKRDAEVARLCAAEMASRKPPDKPREKRGQSTSHEVDEVVAGFHFVCPEEKSVVREIDGLMWSGTWVVAGVHAERALKIDAYIALHRSKAELSYQRWPGSSRQCFAIDKWNLCRFVSLVCRCRASRREGVARPE
jgi:hypothetical protein